MRCAALIIMLAAMAAVGRSQPLPDTMWTRTFPDLGERSPFGIVATADGGAVVAGQQGSQPPPGQDGFLSLFVTRLDADGNVAWDFYYPGTIERWIYARSLCMSPDGDVLVYGGRYTGGGSQDGQNSVILKVSGAGELLWYREYDLRWYEFPYDIQPTLDGGYIVGCGSSSLQSELKGCLLKIDANGDSVWARCYDSDIYAEYVACTPDSGFVFAGRGGGGPTYIALVRTDKFGNELGEYPYFEYVGRPCGIAATADSCFVVAGTANFEPFCMKVDTNGAPLWYHYYFPPDGEHDLVETMCPAADGGFLLAGYHLYEQPGVDPVHIRKLDADGETAWEVLRDVGEYAYCRGIAETGDGGFVIAGGLIPQGEPSLGMLLVARFGTGSFSARPTAAAPSSFSLVQNYPNPFNPATRIGFTLPRGGHTELAIFNSLGQHIVTLIRGPLAAGTHSVTWVAEDLPSGEYMYRLTSGEFTETRTMLLVK